jgi:hypothetical protein
MVDPVELAGDVETGATALAGKSAARKVSKEIPPRREKETETSHA